MVRLMSRHSGTESGQRGAILVVTAFAMVAFVGIAAVVVDVVMLDQTKLRAQAAVDSAVLAAAQDLDDIPIAVAAAQEYALRNHGVTAGDWAGCSDPGALAVATTVNCISIDAATNPTFIRVRLPGRASPTFFGTMFGMSFFTVNASATAEVELSGGADIPTDGDADPEDFQKVADFLRAGDPGGGYDTCNPMRTWLDVTPPATYTDNRGKAAKWGEYIFVFEHLNGTTQTVCGTSSDKITAPDGTIYQWGMDTWVAGTGGTSYPGSGMSMHVSCSQNFVTQGGWDNDFKGNGPVLGLDTEWHIILYIGARYQVSKGKGSEPPAGEIYIKNACGYAFAPVTSSPPTPSIRLSD